MAKKTKKVESVKPKRKRRTKAQMEEARRLEALNPPKPKRKRRTKAEMEEARRLEAEKPKVTSRRRPKVKPIDMKFTQTDSGIDIIEFENGSILSFGKDTAPVKWLYLSYEDGDGVKRGHILPVTLNKVKREYSSVIGATNLTLLRGVIRNHLEGELLPRTKLSVVGEAINLEREKE